MVALMVPIITTPYVSRVLGADGVGAYSYTYSMATYFVMFGNLGVNEYGQIKVAGSRDKRETSQLFWELVLFKIILTTGSLFLFWATVGIHSKYWKLYLVLGFYFLASMTDIAWFLQGMEEFKKTAFRSSFIKISGVLLIVCFVKQPQDVYKYAAIIHLSTILGNLALWGYMPRYLEKVRFKELHVFQHTRQSLTFFLPVIAASVYSVMDKNMIGWITQSEAENGYYEQAHKIQQTILQAVLALSTVLLPRITYLFKTEKAKEIKKLLNRLLQFVACISFPLSLGLIGVADKLVPWFLGEEFRPGIVLLQIFSLLIILIAYDNFIGHQCLMARGMQREFNIGIICGAAANFILNSFLIPGLGSKGAAIASVLSEVVIFSIFFYYGRDLLEVRKIACFTCRYLLAAIIMLICVKLVGDQIKSTAGMIAQVGIGGVVYLGLCFLMRDNIFLEMFAKLRKKM